ncbi:MAG: alpha/beta hydrolase [Candidatus Pacebacteria bacterium]|nr:alpha/beta hydrolase [Candidatus Paceibacterota bacterium]
MANIKEEKVNIDGLDVNYKIAGREGPAVLILHGWGGSSDSWLNVQKELASSGYKVINPDLPGFGKSSPPLEAWSINDYSDLVFKFSDALGLTKFFLLGHSFGGRISIRFSKLHSERIEKLILCGSAGIKGRRDIKSLMIYSAARIGNAIFTPKLFLRFKEGVRSFFYSFIRNRDYVKARGIMRETMIRVLEEDLLPDLDFIHLKTLLVWGEKDKMVPLRFAEVFKEKIGGSELRVLPKVGHSPHLECPQELTSIIKDFFK